MSVRRRAQRIARRFRAALACTAAPSPDPPMVPALPAAIAEATRAPVLAGVRVFVARTGTAMHDVLVCLDERDLQRMRIYRRDIALQDLGELPGLEGWRPNLADPAPVGSYRVFIAGEDPVLLLATPHDGTPAKALPRA